MVFFLKLDNHNQLKYALKLYRRCYGLFIDRRTKNDEGNGREVC